MAPNFIHVYDIIKRQTSEPPTCVTTCMASGDMAGCNSASTICLCQSPTYLTSVSTCLEASCNATDVLIGQQYATAACEAVGVNLNSTTSTNGTSSPSTNTTGTDNPASAIPLTGNPVIYEKTFVNVQAIMSSICAALFALAIVLGVLACRKRLKIQRETQQNSTWTGLGSTTLGGTDTKNGGVSRFGISRNGQSLTRNGGVDSQFDITSMGTLGYNGSSSYNGMRGSINRDPNVPGLNRGGPGVNRLTLGDMGNGSGDEEWEMDVKHSPSSSGKGGSMDEIVPVESPTASTSGIGASTVDLGGDKDSVSNLHTNERPQDEPVKSPYILSKPL